MNLPTKVLGLPDKYIEQGPQDLLRVQYGLTADGIYEEAKALFLASGIGVGERR
jgi:1-deoxy-D-xylulose-5-phosphate synthase